MWSWSRPNELQLFSEGQTEENWRIIHYLNASGEQFGNGIFGRDREMNLCWRRRFAN